MKIETFEFIAEKLLPNGFLAMVRTTKSKGYSIAVFGITSFSEKRLVMFNGVIAPIDTLDDWYEVIERAPTPLKNGDLCEVVNTKRFRRIYENCPHVLELIGKKLKINYLEDEANYEVVYLGKSYELPQWSVAPLLELD